MHPNLHKALKQTHFISYKIDVFDDAECEAYEKACDFLNGKRSFQTEYGVLEPICLQGRNLIFRFQGENYFLPHVSGSHGYTWDYEHVQEVELKEKVIPEQRIQVWEPKIIV